VWHVSIARLGGTWLPVNTDRWGGGVLRAARRAADEILAGVGSGETAELLKPVCLHVRRGLSDEEIAALSPEWMAIPAQDEFSEDGAMETRL